MCGFDRRGFIKTSLLAAGVSVADLSTSLIAKANSPQSVYICPPCGCPMDGKEFAEPGTCPACGMTLVEKNAHSPERLKVAIFVFEGVQIIDFAAPYEVFGQAGYDVFTVGATRSSVTTNMGLSIAPRHDFGDCPRPDVLLIPGGSINRAFGQQPVIDWIRATSRDVRQTLSVCNGAFFLAKAELLNDKSATTFYGAIDRLRSQFPRIMVVSDRRFVDNGAVVTTAGLSSGIDGALHVVAKLSGRGAAQMTALNMEYDWKADASYARASFADMHLHRVFGTPLLLGLPAGYTQTVESTQGDKMKWETVWQVSSKTSVAENELAALIGNKVAQRSRWDGVSQTAASPRREWQFKDDQQQPWRVQLNVERQTDHLRAQLTLQRK